MENHTELLEENLVFLIQSLVNATQKEVDKTQRLTFMALVEGPTMLFIGIIGTFLNIVCMAVLSKGKELKLSHDFLCLLRAQSTFDFLYILTSTPVTVLPSHTFFHLDQPLFILTWIFPFMQIIMTASIYNMIVLAIERYLSIRDISMARTFPWKFAVTLITLLSIAINIPRFFELQVVKEEKSTVKQVNDTGLLVKDFIIQTAVYESVRPAANFYTLGYFLGYNMVGSFLISLFIPIVLLSVFNMLIWQRLKQIWSNQGQLGFCEKRNMRAAFSLIFIIIMFFICHSIKLIISGYQLVDVLITPNIPVKWPTWVENCIFLSHFCLALNASVNILIFCSCDKQFLSVFQGVLTSWLKILGICRHASPPEESMQMNMH